MNLNPHTTCERRRKPDFFIVGAPKSGTTAMAQYLSVHPDIYMAKKEMHFFGEDLRFGRRVWRRNLGAYLNEFRPCNGQRRAGEASVWYLFSKRAADEIRAFDPNSRVIVMLREPVEMLYSMYHQNCLDAGEHLPTFEEALAAEPDRLAGRRINRRAYFAQGLAYRRIVRYTEQVRRYFEILGRDRVHVIIYDDLVADAAATYRRTLDFLGVSTTAADPDLEVVNGNKRIRSKALQYILSDPWFRSVMLDVARRLPRAAFDAFASAEARLWGLNTAAVQRPPLAPDLRSQLKREFAPEVERLSELLDRDLTHWSK